MKIVHVEEFFHPDAGYQVNVLSRLQAKDGHQITVIAAEMTKLPSHLTGFFGTRDISKRDADFTATTGVQIIRVPLLGYYSGRAIFHPSLFRVVAAVAPDVVFVHAMETLTGILFVRKCRSLPYPIVLDSHMLEMASKNRFSRLFTALYRRYVTPVILRERIPTIRVVDSDYVEKQLGIPLTRTELASFGTDTSHFKPDPLARAATRQSLGIEPGAFLVLYAGKLDEAKGGQFLARAIAERFPAQRGRHIEFLIIGNCDGRYGTTVESLLSQSRNRVIRLPTQRYYDLARFYQAADMAVFPRQCSLSFFEAQSCGLPVLFEYNEINAQRASHGNARTFIADDILDFRRQLVDLATLPTGHFHELRDNSRRYVLRNFDFVPVARHFDEILAAATRSWHKD